MSFVNIDMLELTCFNADLERENGAEVGRKGPLL